jgi:hypothetical protein
LWVDKRHKTSSNEQLSEWFLVVRLQCTISKPCPSSLSPLPNYIFFLTPNKNQIIIFILQISPQFLVEKCRVRLIVFASFSSKYVFSIKFDDSKLKQKKNRVNVRSLRIIRDKLSYSLSQIDDIVHLELSKAKTCQSTR